MRGLKVLAILFTVVFLIPASTGYIVDLRSKSYNNRNSLGYSNFYFVHLTDTHVSIFGYPPNAEKYLKKVIKKLESLPDKPAFVVLTGDLVEFGGSGYFGAKNYREFLKCVRGKKNNLYFDGGRRIYTIPGNHDYRPQSSLSNYHRYISSFDRYLIIYRNIVILCLNSGKDVIKGGKLKASGLSNSDIHWIETNLKNFPDKIKIIAMHHPISSLTKNKNKLISLCKKYNVEAIICGHTHRSKVRDIYGRGYSTPVDCYTVPPLIVETDACFHHGAYRPIEVSGNHLIIKNCKYAS